MIPASAPRDSRLIDAGGIRLACTEHGSGPTIVWLHGSGPGASGMANFAANLPAFDDFRNIVFDLPRFGGSDKPDIEEPLIPYAAERVAAALNTLGVDSAHIVGNSFGGGVAMELAATHSDRIRALVLMAPGGTQPASTESWPDGLQRMLAYLATPSPRREDLAHVLTAMVYDPTILPEQLIDDRYQASLQAHPEVTLPPRFGSVEHHLDRVTAPTLLLWWQNDRFVPVEWGLQLLARLPDAEMRIVPRCGHWLQVEYREYFNETTRAWFTKAETGRRPADASASIVGNAVHA
jgi:pimeloyl-ACP methyl ester carboxylesterase